MYWNVIRWGGSAAVLVIVVLAALQSANNTGSRGPSAGPSYQTNPAADRYRK